MCINIKAPLSLRYENCAVLLGIEQNSPGSADNTCGLWPLLSIGLGPERKASPSVPAMHEKDRRDRSYYCDTRLASVEDKSTRPKSQV